MTTHVIEQFDDAVAVTPNDTNTFRACRGLYIGGAGNVNVVTAGGNDVTFSSLAAGTILKLSVMQVKNTGTTATNIVALY